VSIEVAVMKRLPASGLLVLSCWRVRRRVLGRRRGAGSLGVPLGCPGHRPLQRPAGRRQFRRGTAHHYRKTDRGALQARLKAKSELDAAGEVREGQESDADAAAETDRQKVLAERDTNCKAAKDRVAKYTMHSGSISPARMASAST
jgi:hypothetical protein